MIDACDRCLRRAFLIAHLAPRIAGLLGQPRAGQPGLLSLADDELIAVAGGCGARSARSFVARFDAAGAHAELRERRLIALCLHAPGYPPQLHELPDPPAVLFAVGQPKALESLRTEPAVAIVGARRASPYGTEMAYALGRGLGAAGLPVVSGLALGIDGTAHRGCLDAGGLPIAVLACGPNVVYPRRHRALHERVRAAGVVLSELPPGAEPYRWSFPARNRIMAGLARMTIVVEAADPSGSLITSDFAKDLGRSVAAVPGRVTSRTAKGVNNLLRDGAVPVTGTEDVLDEIFGVGMREVPEFAAAPPIPADPLLRRVLEAAELSSSVEEIARGAELSTGEVRAALGRLEIDGHIIRRDLGGWERVAG